MPSPSKSTETVGDAPPTVEKRAELPEPAEPAAPERCTTEEKKEESPQLTEETAEKSAGDEAKKAPKTRLLKDVEAEERRYIYENLYKSIETEDDKAAQDHLTVSDTLRFAKEARAEFYRTCSLPVSERFNEVLALVATMANVQLPFLKKALKGEPVVRSAASKQHNHKVLNIFVLVTVMMFTLPLIALFAGMHVLAPRFNVDPVLCGGFLSVATVLAISVGYTIYGLNERAPSDVAAEQGKEALKATEPRPAATTETKKEQ